MNFRNLRLARQSVTTVVGLLVGGCHHQPLPQPPDRPMARVIDLSNQLQPRIGHVLGAQLREIEQRNGTRIFVLVVSTTNGEPIASYSQKIANIWASNRPSVSQDAIVVLSAKECTAWIGTGRRFPSQIDPSQRSFIIQEFISPELKAGAVTQAAAAAVQMMGYVVSGETMPQAAIPGARRFWAESQVHPITITLLAGILLVVGWWFVPIWCALAAAAGWAAAAAGSVIWGDLGALGGGSMGLLAALVILASLLKIRWRANAVRGARNSASPEAGVAPAAGQDSQGPGYPVEQPFSVRGSFKAAFRAKNPSV